MNDVVVALVPMAVIVAAWILYMRYNPVVREQSEDDKNE
jgi:hypothetical protein